MAKDKRGLLCIVEVKLRGSGSIALPREFVDGRKQQRLRSAAELYLAANELDVPVRFDVAEVYDEGGSSAFPILKTHLFSLIKEETDMKYYSTRDKNVSLSAAEA